MRDLLKKIPKPKFGKEPKLDKVLEAHPDIATDPKYKEWLVHARKLENMTKNFGVHAAGLVISDHPISDRIPVWMKRDVEKTTTGQNRKVERWVTQYDMKETEELGLIKFDFLSIDNLSILKECTRLIKKHQGIDIDPYDIAANHDGDHKAYTMMHHGLLTGLFQMETSGSAKELIQKSKPFSIPEVSDVSALNRPGPMQAGLHLEYAINKQNGYAPSDMPAAVAEILKDTYWVLVYQEQIMRLCTDIAGFTLKEADDIRRAMGKKDHEYLAPKREQFIEGFFKADIPRAWTENFWITLAGDPDDETKNGFADYCFNKSHSISYSMITYMCAYLKAHFPAEFFCALMTIRSQSLPPKDWREKAPEYISEAKTLGVTIKPPSVNKSHLGFTIRDQEVFFGFNAIRDVGKTAARSIVRARAGNRFKSAMDFVMRINLQKVTTKSFQALVKAGAFDAMGYPRATLLAETNNIYAYPRSLQAYAEREKEIEIRDAENSKKNVRKERLEIELKLAKAKKKNKELLTVSDLYTLDRLDRLKQARLLVKSIQDENLTANDVLSGMELVEYEESLWLRKKPTLKSKPQLDLPDIPRAKTVSITVTQLMVQAEYIGCYIGVHPARILFPNHRRINALDVGDKVEIAGCILEAKELTDRNGNKMAFIKLGDGTAVAELICFSSIWKKVQHKYEGLSSGQLITAYGKVEETEAMIKLIPFSIELHRSTNT